MSDKTGRYQVIGPPGTGKTTWLGNEVRKCVAAGLVVCVSSLTRAAATQVIKKDLPVPREHVSTLHAHAYRAIDRPTLYTAKLDEWNDQNPYLAMRDARREDGTTDDLMNAPQPGEYPGDDLYEACDLYRHRQIPVKAWDGPQREFFARWTAWKAETEVIDFTDMIERALAETQTPRHSPDVLLVDEAQDLSALEYQLLCHWELRSRALIITGDPQQSLYSWRGADPELFNDPDVLATHKRVLGQSYRVPRAIHAAATRWVRRLSDYRPAEYLPRKYEGRAERFHGGCYKAPHGVVEAASNTARGGKTVMIVASCAYMLQPTIKILRERGIPFANPWRLKRGDWNPLRFRKKQTTTPQRLLSFLKPIIPEHVASVWSTESDEPASGELGAPWTLSEFGQWVELLSTDKCVKRGAKVRLKKMVADTPDRSVQPDDLGDVLNDEAFGMAVLMLAGDRTPKSAIEWLARNTIPSKQAAVRYPASVITHSGAQALTDEPRIFVGTAHSFKGAEASHVYLYPEISNAAAEHMMRHGMDAIIRTFYVAMTRAREELYVCVKCDPRAVEIEL